ncbi:hypothetical protein PILCRDRAFT_818139 [Piloderma croceum F 1598]|uniref:Copper acquisition factor BIM1-like domain-containing protein n=1 Tax=Piloderma croceum (strain F 1598) TaxID=765440 RepID=A0A0C3FY08_PILCF|nr:hypothetical protein PILCRDRAFT_818139 [Piloderma croceum F 1598]
MRLSAVATFLGLASAASAHFQMQYPAPRGPFVEDNEPSFCDGYTDAVSNRTTFPLTNGVIKMNSEHPTWTVGVVVSTKQNPTAFGDFNNASNESQLAVNYFQTTGEGLACFNIDLSKSGIPGVQDGANITIEVVYDGGDGQLYQCADLTLSSTVSVPSNATSSCKNITSAESNTTASSTSTSPSASTSSTKTGAAVGSMARVPGVVAGLLVLTGAVLAL